MIKALLLGLGLVAIIEGLVLALAPSRLRDVLEMIERMEPEQRRTIGLTVVALGVVLVWILLWRAHTVKHVVLTTAISRSSLSCW